MRRKTLLVACLGAFVFVLGGCSGGSAEGDVVVEMLDNSFAPSQIEIPVGGSVTFLGAGRAPHNAVAADGSWSTETAVGSLVMLDGDTATISFDQPGAYRFFCTFHGTADGGGMAGTIIVGGADPGEILAGDTSPVGIPAAGSGVVRAVPGTYPTIQTAVDAADPGDLVLVDRGVYREQVDVVTPGIVIRGVDRNEVIIDGESQRENGVNVVGADGVVVENLTVRGATANGLFWNDVVGYRASYVTSIDAGVYGIYAFASVDGVFEHSYASGSPDSGFYIGECKPCNAVINDVISEWNGLGYSGTNSSGALYLVNSVWRNNVAGIVPNTLDSELLPPFEGVSIVGNVVHDNSNPDAPTYNAPWSAFGNGIVLAGGNDSLVARNRIFNHVTNGILVTPNLDKNFWMSHGNIVRDNVIEGSGRADLALAGPAGDGNCFVGNDFRWSLPPAIEALAPCDGLRLPLRFELGGAAEGLGRVAEGTGGLNTRPNAAVGSAPKPGPQPQMPDAMTAPATPAVDVFANYPIDLEAIGVPPMPDGLDITQRKGITVFGLFFASALSVFFGLYAYLLPFVLYAAWVALALWDLARREDLSRGATLGWTAVVLVVPFLGVIVYHSVGKSLIPGWQRATFIGGGFAAYLVILVIGALVGGIV